MTLSVVISALNAASTLPATLAALGAAPDEIIVVDGGSADATREIAWRGARLVQAPRGRGRQVAAGVAAATCDWLLLLHADTRLMPGWVGAARAHMARPGSAGYFRFALDSADPRARRLEHAVAWRCRTLCLPYGDQGLLIHRGLLERIGGVRPLPVMEDVDLVRRLGRNRLVPLAADAITSAVRWERGGWRRRSALNVACLALWFAGAPPALIARVYR